MRQMTGTVDPRTIRGLVFDKDGTLFDFHATWSVWANGLIDSLSEGRPDRAEELAGRLGFDRAAQQFLPDSAVIAGTMEVVIDAIRATVPEIAEPPLRRLIMSGTAAAQQIEVVPLVPLLDRLRASGMTLGLATNDSEAPARAHLERAGILDRFAFVAGYDSGHGPKPTPGMLTAFSAATGIAPAACAMIGDSTHDLESGRAAGMAAVAVLTGIAGRDELAPHADVVLESVADLPAWLGLP